MLRVPSPCRLAQAQQWPEASAQPSALLRRTEAFLEQVHHDLAGLRRELACCATAHVVPASSYHFRGLLGLLLGLAALTGTVCVASPRSAKKRL